jgi:IS605 OrfB family transposase
MPDCKNASTQGRIERPSTASTKSINYPLSNRFEKMSYKLVRDFGTIVVEDLKIKGLSGLLSKAVHHVGWSSFINMLSCKAENAGRQLLKVDPNYTSQECPNGHAIEKKQLSERVHRCDCGLTIHRDHAAARVILGRGLRLQAETKPEVSVSVA